jgi:hypothetical protein
MECSTTSHIIILVLIGKSSTKSDFLNRVMGIVKIYILSLTSDDHYRAIRCATSMARFCLLCLQNLLQMTTPVLRARITRRRLVAGIRRLIIKWFLVLRVSKETVGVFNLDYYCGIRYNDVNFT